MRRKSEPNPQINVSKISGGDGIAGAMVAVISTVIFLIGIPALRYFLPAAIILGCVVALIIRLSRHETPGAPWIVSSTEKSSGIPSGAQTRTTPSNTDQPESHPPRFRRHYQPA